MLRFGIAASLLSLGAIDFGMIVDSSVVMIENCVRHIAHGDLAKKSKLDMIRDAAAGTPFMVCRWVFADQGG
jgi:cobalt-zinc-cadmium resistance protein CzcA